MSLTYWAIEILNYTNTDTHIHLYEYSSLLLVSLLYLLLRNLRYGTQWIYTSKLRLIDDIIVENLINKLVVPLKITQKIDDRS